MFSLHNFTDDQAPYTSKVDNRTWDGSGGAPNLKHVKRIELSRRSSIATLGDHDNTLWDSLSRNRHTIARLEQRTP